MGPVIRPRPGSYILDLYLASRKRLRIGRLGTFEFNRGHYYYCGSAQGPGGLRARLAHHLTPSPHPHWHIDYLKQTAPVKRILLVYGHDNKEHHWARLLAAHEGCSLPIPGFGSSDCTCPSHLIYCPGPGLTSPEPEKRWTHVNATVIRQLCRT